MTDTARELFIAGLRNAHAMEIQARELLERQSKRLADYPEIKVRIANHLEETRTQIERLEQCLKSFGESSSSLKDATMSIAGNAAALMHSVVEDEVLKNTFANNAFENYEVAAYKSLLELCKETGASSSREPLLLSLKEEEAMAAWIDQNVENITQQFLARQQKSKTEPSMFADTLTS